MVYSFRLVWRNLMLIIEIFPLLNHGLLYEGRLLSSLVFVQALQAVSGTGVYPIRSSGHYPAATRSRRSILSTMYIVVFFFNAPLSGRILNVPCAGPGPTPPPAPSL